MTQTATTIDGAPAHPVRRPLRLSAPPDVVTTVTLPEADYLSGHPDVRRVAFAPAEAWDGMPMVTVALWVEEIDDLDYEAVMAARRARGRKRPDRAPDLELCGEAPTPAGFFDRLPNLEAYAAIEEFDPPYWAAKIWLTAGAPKA